MKTYVFAFLVIYAVSSKRLLQISRKLVAKVIQPSSDACESLASFWDKNRGMFGSGTLKGFLANNKPFAKGGFGQVYYLPNDSRYVFKYMSLQRSADVQSFKTETNLMNELSKNQETAAYIVKMHGCFLDRDNDGSEYAGIIMERLGPSLHHLKNEFSSLSPVERVRVYIQLGNLLLIVNRFGICHNDFKPANVLSGLENKWEFKLADFGLSCPHGNMCGGGTPFYDAPEKTSARTAKYICKENIDVWALLATIVELEVQEKVYELYTICSKTNREQCPSKTRQSFAMYSLNRSPQFIQMIGKELAASPDKRSTMEMLLKNLEGWVEAQKKLLNKKQSLLTRLFGAKKQKA